MVTTDAVGGVWRYSLELSAQLASRGARVVLTAMGPRPDAAQRREAAAVSNLRLLETDLPLDWLAESPAELANAARELAALAATHDAGSVQLHTPALVGGAAWPCPVAAVVHSCVATWWRAVHGGALPADLAWRADAVACGIATADAIIAPSRSFAADVATTYSGRRDIDVVLNGRRPLAVHSATHGFVFTAGRLWDPGKNVAVIDTAAGLLDVPVLAAGPLTGPHGASIACQHLRCLGPLDEAAMAEQYAAAGVFVSLARYEPFGLAVLEAAQAGCALVLSDISTFRELWDGAAEFVDPADAHALAAAISDLRTDGRRDRLGALAQQRAAQYNAEQMGAATWRVHQALNAAPAGKAA